jgi:hypothetical protein
MDEYSALAQRVALTLDDVRGCLVLSRDGMILGVHPEEEESVVKQAWLRFVHVGEPRKSFVEFGDQIWGYVHRGAYAAFIVTGSSIRPGVLLDQLEQVLLTAEESRTRRDSLKIPDAAAAPSSKPRTTLHPPGPTPQATPVSAVPGVDPVVVAGGATPPQPPVAPEVGTGGTREPAQAEPPSFAPAAEVAVAPTEPAPGWPQEAPQVPPEGFSPEPSREPARGPWDLPPSEPAREPWHQASQDVSSPNEPGHEKDKKKDKDKEKDKDKDKKGGSGLGKEPQRLVSSGWMTGQDGAVDDSQEDPSEIDRVLLAKEFSGLLQLDETGDEGSS